VAVWWSSPTPRVLSAPHGVDVVRRVQILWQGPDDGTLVKRELQMIIALRHNDPRHGFNLMPQLVGVNIALKLDWTHNQVTHVHSTNPEPSRV
jgi:hypothetical protein